MNKIIALKFAVFLLTFASQQCVAQADTLGTKLEELEEIKRSTFELGYETRRKAKTLDEAFHQRFDDEIESSKLKVTSTAGLHVLFKAASMITFYANSRDHTRTLESIFNELHLRQATDSTHVKDMYDAYVSVRDFARAKTFRDRLNLAGTIDLPIVIMKSKVSAPIPIWRVSPSESKIEEVKFEFPAGPQIVVVSSPSCHFSENALSAFERDPLLFQKLSAHALFLSPQLYDFDYRAIQGWMRKHPRFSFAAVNSRDEWRNLAEWSTPTFYFFFDGALKHSFSGWPAMGNFAELRKGLSKIGINETAGRKSNE